MESVIIPTSMAEAVVMEYDGSHEIGTLTPENAEFITFRGNVQASSARTRQFRRSKALCSFQARIYDAWSVSSTSA